MKTQNFDIVEFPRLGAEALQFSVPSVAEESVRQSGALLQADADFAKRYGGDFVRSVVEGVERRNLKYPLLVDSKVHMVKPGWYPGIPGWHVDFAPHWESVVEWKDVDPNERHFMAISSGVSCTEFLADTLSLPIPRAPKANGYIARLVEALGESVQKVSVEPNQVYEFGQLHIHRVTPAVASGWRMFVRVSATKLRPVLNEVRSQASQVYITDINAGW